MSKLVGGVGHEFFINEGLKLLFIVYKIWNGVMTSMVAKKIRKQQLAGLLVGTGLAASIQLALVRPFISFYIYVITLYFLAGLIFGYLTPRLSWRGGIWLTLPWIAWIFFNIAGAGFKDGILGSAGWLFFYSFPVLPACVGALAGAAAAPWKKIIP